MALDMKVTMDAVAVENMLSGLSSAELKQALEDIGQMIINSVKVGYTREVGPDGEKWEENAPWYKQMKGGAATLTGPISTTIRGGQYAGRYKFASINTARMKNTLVKEVTSDSVTIRYKASSADRARITHEGGEGKIELVPIGGGTKLILDVTIPARPHLGVAENYARLQPKTDVEWIEEIISDMVDKNIG